MTWPDYVDCGVVTFPLFVVAGDRVGTYIFLEAKTFRTEKELQTYLKEQDR